MNIINTVLPRIRAPPCVHQFVFRTAKDADQQAGDAHTKGGIHEHMQFYQREFRLSSL